MLGAYLCIKRLAAAKHLPVMLGPKDNIRIGLECPATVA